MPSHTSPGPAPSSDSAAAALRTADVAEDVVETLRDLAVPPQLSSVSASADMSVSIFTPPTSDATSPMGTPGRCL